MENIVTMKTKILLLICTAAIFFMPFAQAGENMIQNPSFDQEDPLDETLPLHWKADQWGTLDAEFRYPVTGQDGGKAVQVQVTNYTDGDAKWAFHHIPVSAGKNYRFSDSYRSDVETEIILEHQMSDGTLYYDDPFKTVPASADWATTEGIFTPPEGAVSTSVLHIIKSIGTLSVDSASLSSDIGGNSDLVINGTLETTSSPEVPESWEKGFWGGSDAVFRYPVSGVHGSKAAEVIIRTWSGGDAKWYFRDIPVTPGGEYTFSDQYKSSTESSIVIRYAHGADIYSYAELGVELPPNSTWTPISRTFTVPTGVKQVTIFHLIKSIGTLAIDNVSLRATTGGSAQSGMVTLTFDDNWNSQDVVLPILEAAGIKSTFYLVTEDLSDSLSREKIREIYDAGHEMGAHTRTHPSLVGLSAEQMHSEIAGSRQDIIDAGMAPVNTFAYPFGDYNDEVIQTTKDAGFTGARGVWEGYNTKDSNGHHLLVQNIRNTTTPEDIGSWIQEAQKNDSWLILVFHPVDYENDPYGITPENFAIFINYLVRNKIPTGTMNQGLQRMEHMKTGSFVKK